MKSKVLTITVIATVALIAMIGIKSNSVKEINAQNMTMTGDFGNMTSGMREKMMINGTINLQDHF
jgi:hypothetical protein